MKDTIEKNLITNHHCKYSSGAAQWGCTESNLWQPLYSPCMTLEHHSNQFELVRVDLRGGGKNGKALRIRKRSNKLRSNGVTEIRASRYVVIFHESKVIVFPVHNTACTLLCLCTGLRKHDIVFLITVRPTQTSFRYKYDRTKPYREQVREELIRFYFETFIKQTFHKGQDKGWSVGVQDDQ